jgi:hypothetical protein
LKTQLQKIFKQTEKYKAIRRSATFALANGRTFSGRSEISAGSNSSNEEPRNIIRSSYAGADMKRSFLEIIETRAGVCYNLKQIFKY